MIFILHPLYLNYFIILTTRRSVNLSLLKKLLGNRLDGARKGGMGVGENFVRATSMEAGRERDLGLMGTD